MTIAETARQIGIGQGLPLSFGGTSAEINALDPNQKIALTNGILTYIRNNPAQFSEAQVYTANHSFTKSGDPLADASFSAGDFIVEFGNNANDLVVKPLVTLGQNVSSTANLLATLVPVIIIGGLILYFLPSIRAKLKTP